MCVTVEKNVFLVGVITLSTATTPVVQSKYGHVQEDIWRCVCVHYQRVSRSLSFRSSRVLGPFSLAIKVVHHILTCVCVCLCVHRALFAYDGVTNKLKLADSGGKVDCHFHQIITFTFLRPQNRLLAPRLWLERSSYTLLGLL